MEPNRFAFDAGMRRRLLAGAERVVGTYGTAPADVPRTDAPAGGGLRVDRHLHREILFIVGGDSRFWLDGRLYPARPGTAFLLDRWEPHSFGYATGDRGLVHLWFHAAAKSMGASMLFVECGVMYWMGANSAPVPDDLRDFVLRRWDALAAEAPCSAERIRERMGAPLAALLSEYALAQDELSGAERPALRDVVAFLEHYIENMNGRDCSLARLAALCGYSRFHLTRLFRARTGRTIGARIQEARTRFVGEAERRGLRQKEIARELGFASPASYWLWRHGGKA